jgi:hypothetical protein
MSDEAFDIQRISLPAQIHNESRKTCGICRAVFWVCRGIRRFVVWIKTGIQDWFLARKASKISKDLDNSEKEKVNFTDGVLQPVNFLSILTSAQQHLQKMSKCRSSFAIKEANRLDQRIIGLQYRLEQSNEGLSPVTDNVTEQGLFDALVKQAAKWKQSKELYVTKELVEDDRKKLHEAATYPAFAELLLKDSHLRNRFFNWIIPYSNEWQPYHGNDVAAFIQFPSMVDRIRSCFLASRIQSYQGVGLQIEIVTSPEGIVQKDLTLPFEKLNGDEMKRRISILDPNLAVQLVGKTGEGKLTITIKEIFQSFQDKQKRYGPLEFLRGRIRLWDALELGYWHEDKKQYARPDLTKENWWEAFPITDRLSSDEAALRYKQPDNCEAPFNFQDPKDNWIIAPRFTRQSKQNALAGHHAYYEIAIPREKNGDWVYEIRSFGRLAKDFPVKQLEYFSLVAKPVRVGMSCPDENRYYPHRDHGGIGYTKQNALAFMNDIKIEIERALAGERRFQLLYMNCMTWVRKLAQKHELPGPGREFPDLTIDFLQEMAPVGLAGTIITRLRASKNGECILSSCLRLFGSKQSFRCATKNGKPKKICLADNIDWKKFGNPAKFFELKEKGLLDPRSPGNPHPIDIIVQN